MRQLKWPPLSELDEVIIGSWRIARPRLVVFALIAVCTTVGWGLKVGLAWTAAMGASEIAMWVAARPFVRGWPARRIHRLTYAAAAVASVFTLLSISLLFWHSPGEGGRFIALVLWSVLLVNAISFAFRSLLAMLIFFVPVALVMTLTPLLAPRFEGSQQVMAACGVAIFAIYAGLSAYRDAIAARALNAANAELERARQAAESANAAKSAFLATMSHEIRTPLNGVLGMAQVMERESLPKRQRERLSVIQRSGETLLVLLNDLLDLSRIESGRLELEEGELDIEDIAAGARDTFQALADDKAVELELTVEPAARGRWRGDPTRVRQILHNLVSNAVKFTADGVVAIHVGHDGEALVMAVTDSGPGIPPERQAAMFDRFTQADTSTTRRFGGSGLGLAICRELAEMLGGSITLESAEGQGSTFTVRLPLARAAPARPAAVRERKPAARRRRGRTRILAAEDNPTNRLVLETMLDDLGVELVVVEDGAAALDAYREEAWDLVLMDIQMPLMDGPAAARAIRGYEASERRPRTPILALTANVMAHQAEDYRAAGMDGVVAKPLQRGQLVAVIEAALSEGRKTAA
jgi:signal transduction histidine kinase